MNPNNNSSNEWPLKKIKEVCYINPSKKEMGDLKDDTVVSFIPMSSISTDGLRLSKQSKKLKYVRKGYTYFREGDVLFAKITPCMENGKRWLAKSLSNGIGFGSTEFHVIRPKSGLISEWVYYFISRKIFREKVKKSMTGTAGQKRVPAHYLGNITIPLPPVTIQKRLAEVMKDVETLKLKRVQANKLIDKSIKSIFFRLFGEKKPTTNIGNISTYVSSGSTPKGGQKTYLEKGITFLRSQNVLMNELRYHDVAHISEEVHNAMKRTWLKNGDVLLNITGASLGRVAIYRGPDDKANVNQHVCIIRLDRKKAIPEYVSHYLSSSHAQKQIWTIQAGASRQALNYKQVKSLDIFLPDLNSQKTFALIAQNFEALRGKQIFVTSEISEFFESVLYQAFSNQLALTDCGKYLEKKLKSKKSGSRGSLETFTKQTKDVK